MAPALASRGTRRCAGQEKRVPQRREPRWWDRRRGGSGRWGRSSKRGGSGKQGAREEGAGEQGAGVEGQCRRNSSGGGSRAEAGGERCRYRYLHVAATAVSAAASADLVATTAVGFCAAAAIIAATRLSERYASPQPVTILGPWRCTQSFLAKAFWCNGLQRQGSTWHSPRVGETQVD